MSDTPGADPAPDRRRSDGNDHLEMWVGSTRDRIPLRGEKITIGQASTNDVPLAFDRTVSRVHCVIEPIASRWCVRDLSSRNGKVLRLNPDGTTPDDQAANSPMFSGDVFREPASTRQIASDLVVTEAAVKQHLSRLYDKFEIFEQEGRRARLANEAIRRGAVNTAEIRGQKPPDA